MNALNLQTTQPEQVATMMETLSSLLSSGGIILGLAVAVVVIGAMFRSNY